MTEKQQIENRILKIQKEFNSHPSEIEELKIAKKKVAIIMGAGDGLGSSLARLFASHNFITIVCRRNKTKLQPLIEEIQNKGQVCHGYGIDARKEDQVIKLLDDVEKFYGEISVGIFNPGVNIKVGINETTSRQFQKIWEMNAYAGFLFGRELSIRMVKKQRGTIIFTGASASLRGNEGFAAFSSSKMALRGLAQSMAKELGPQNIHVSHVIIDGGIDSPFIRDMMRSKLKQGIDVKDQLLQPDHIAQNYWNLYKQPKSSWTFELDLRPFTEKF